MEVGLQFNTTTMNIYYYFSVNDLFFTEASQKLVEKNPEINFFGLAGGRRNFFKGKTYKSITYLSELDVSEKAIIDYHYLREKELEYGFLVADLISAERNFSNFSKAKKILYAQQIIKIIERDFQTTDIDYVILEGIDDLPSLFLSYFLKKMKIPYYYFIYARMGDAVFLSNRLDTGPVDLDINYEKNLADFNNNQGSFDSTKKTIGDYISQKQQPYYVTESNMLYKIFAFSDFSRIKKAFKNYYLDKSAYQSVSYGNPLYYPFLRLKKILNKKKYDSYFSKNFISSDELSKKKYFVYPLHFHPEAATLIQGRWFNNQQEIIEIFAKSLPADTILVVKEHKVSIGRRNINFYKEINKIVNVHFVNENTDVYPLIGNSAGIVTISSSMGLEAVMLNKAVLTFGDIHYNILKQVVKARDISKMQLYVKEALNFQGYNQDEYWAFFKTITENWYHMPGYSPHKFTPQHIDTFIQMVGDITRNKLT